MAPLFQIHKVSIPRDLFKRKDWVKYLVLVNWHAGRFENVLTAPADDAFSDFVETQVRTYLDGTAPPESIQTAVMNIADDVAAGREVTLRAGDYIALQNQYLNTYSKSKQA
jgi:hypothetical protein